MYSRGKSINPEKQEKLDNMAKQFAAGGKKKWVRYDEGALLYSMGIHSFMNLAEEAEAKRGAFSKIGRGFVDGAGIIRLQR